MTGLGYRLDKEEKESEESKMVDKDDEHFVACVTEIGRGELVWRWAEDGNFSSGNTECEVYVE